MKVCTCFLLFGIFAYTNSLSRIRPKGDHGVAHLPQETVEDYSNEEYSGDTNSLDSVHKYITRGTTVQDENTELVFRASRVKTLTDFIQEAVHILNTYEDTAFEDFFHVLDFEIRKYHYRGCKFSELTQNSDTRSLLAGSLKLIRGKPVSFTKANINKVADMLRDETYDTNVKDLLDYINSLYTNNELTFHSILNELKYYRNTKTVRTHHNLVQVIKNGLRAVLFNPYTELDTHTRRELKDRIETFWKQFKNYPESSAEMNYIPYKGPVIKSVSNSIKVSENIMNEVYNPEPYSENDPQVKSKNKRERIVSIETYNERFQDDETEKDGSSNEFGKQITNYNTDEISSGQSFDSSSNSIKNSQERQVEYNKQRYVTLYTEEISYKPMTLKKTEIIPISANVTNKRPKVKKRPTTTSTPRESDVSSDRTEKIEMLRANHDSEDTILDKYYSSHDIDSGLTLESKHEPRAGKNYDQPRKQGKADESRSKSKHKNVEIISQYDAVIDVQLANTELLKSLRMFEPLGMDTKYDTTLYQKGAIQTETIPLKSTKRPGSMRAEAETKAPIPTALKKSPSKYSKKNKPFYKKQLNDFRNNITPLLPNEGKNQNQKYLRSFDNDTTEAEDFSTYVIKKINAMNNEIKELKQINHFSFRRHDNNTDVVEAINVTDKTEALDKIDSKRKHMKGNVIEKLLNEDHDLNNEEVVNRHKFTMNIESSTTTTKSPKLNVIKKDAINATVIDNNNTTQVGTNNISKINVNVTKKLSKEVININVTTTTISLVKVTNTTKIESVVTAPTIGMTRRTMAYSEPSYYDSLQENHSTVRNSRFDAFFDHVNDGIDLHM